ncbi:hypothetical protein MNBD_CHLOROFLEXI01-3695, partial [hydrothermal vent metagenome]
MIPKSGGVGAGRAEDNFAMQNGHFSARLAPTRLFALRGEPVTSETIVGANHPLLTCAVPLAVSADGSPSTLGVTEYWSHLGRGDARNGCAVGKGVAASPRPYKWLCFESFCADVGLKNRNLF